MLLGSLLCCGPMAVWAQAAEPQSSQRNPPAAAQGSAQQDPVQQDPVQQAAPPKGKVLFERHASVAEGDAAPAPEPPPESTTAPLQSSAGQVSEEQGSAAVSSSMRRRTTGRGLQRRTPDAAKPVTGEAAMPVQPKESGAPIADSGISSSAAEPVAVSSSAAPAISASDQKASAAIPDADRSAPQIVSEDLELHLNQHTGAVTARARMELRNGGATPLSRIPLQISSALQWQSAQVVSAAGAPVPLAMEQHRLLTDADHTGAATEASFALPKPLAPGETVSLDLFYGGVLGQSAERLLRLGAPSGRAAQSDWDTVGEAFTGLRGYGNVLWFPVASAPLLLADGAAFVHAVEEELRRTEDARISLRLTLETVAGSAPDAAFFHGERQPLVAIGGDESGPADGERSALYTSQWGSSRLGAHPLSLFVAESAPQQTAAGLLDAVTGHADTVAAYSAAAARVQPLLAEWLGPRPASPLHVLDLPFAGAQPFADGSLLVLPMRAAEPQVLAASLLYPMASAWLPAAAPAWLREGVPEFLRLLYVERTEGREAALVDLNASGDLLARQESFATSSTPPLAHCVDAACARTKAAFVLGMLRSIAGEDALKQALTAWRTTVSDTPQRQTAAVKNANVAIGMGDAGIESGAAGDAASTARFEQRLTQSSGKDLRWFFQDWIDRDAGLPELQIVSVAPRRVERGTVNNTVPTERRPTAGPIGPEPVPQPGDPAQQEQASQASRNRVGSAEGSWLVAVAVQNNGGAAAEVPVTVRSGGLQNVLPLRIPAHSRATIRVPFEAMPEEVWVNDGTTPEMRSVTHHRTIDAVASRGR